MMVVNHLRRAQRVSIELEREIAKPRRGVCAAHPTRWRACARSVSTAGETRTPPSREGKGLVRRPAEPNQTNGRSVVASHRTTRARPPARPRGDSILPHTPPIAPPPPPPRPAGRRVVVVVVAAVSSRTGPSSTTASCRSRPTTSRRTRRRRDAAHARRAGPRARRPLRFSLCRRRREPNPHHTARAPDATPRHRRPLDARRGTRRGTVCNGM